MPDNEISKTTNDSGDNLSDSQAADTTKPAKEVKTRSSRASKTTSVEGPAEIKPVSPFAVPELHEDRPAIKGKFLGMAVLLVISTSAGFLGGWIGASREEHNSLGGLSQSAQQRSFSEQSELISSIAETVGPSVVSIDVTGEAQAPTNTYFGFGGGGTRATQSAGTGIILTGNGLVVTNRHVVPEGTSKVSVTLSDGTTLDDVTVIGRSRDSDPLDVAFLKINDAKGKKLTPAKIGDSSKVHTGDRVVAIGNALGQFQNTVTSGIISGFGRNVQAGDGEMGGDVESLQDLFQTDAAINQGNSGGPLVNISGEVIGINTAVAGDAQGIGFAIPVNNISGLIKSVISTGEFKQPYLGVRYISLTDDLAKQFGIKDTKGAYILPADQTGQPAIVAGSPAEKAGLKAGDVITEVDGTAVDENHSLSTLLSSKSVGDTVSLKVKRDGKTSDVSAKLDAAPNQ